MCANSLLNAASSAVVLRVLTRYSASVIFIIVPADIITVQGLNAGMPPCSIFSECVLHVHPHSLMRTMGLLAK